MREREREDMKDSQNCDERRNENYKVEVSSQTVHENYKEASVILVL